MRKSFVLPVAAGILAVGLTGCAGNTNHDTEPGNGWQGTNASPKADTGGRGQDSGAFDKPNSGVPAAKGPASAPAH